MAAVVPTHLGVVAACSLLRRRRGAADRARKGRCGGQDLGGRVVSSALEGTIEGSAGQISHCTGRTRDRTEENTLMSLGKEAGWCDFSRRLDRRWYYKSKHCSGGVSDLMAENLYLACCPELAIRNGLEDRVVGFCSRQALYWRHF